MFNNKQNRKLHSEKWLQQGALQVQQAKSQHNNNLTPTSQITMDKKMEPPSSPQNANLSMEHMPRCPTHRRKSFQEKSVTKFAMSTLFKTSKDD